MRSSLRYLFWFLVCLAVPIVATGADNGVTVSGRVHSSDGVAVSQGRVELIRLDEGAFAEPTISAPFANGRFELRAPEPGMWRLTVRAEGFMPAAATLEPLLGPFVLPPVFLPDDVGVDIEVVDEQGRALPGVLVRAQNIDLASWPRAHMPQWLPAPRQGRSDQAGRLRMPRSDSEKLALSAWSPGRALVFTSDVASWKAVLPTTVPRRLRFEPGATKASLLALNMPRIHLEPGDWTFESDDKSRGVLTPLNGEIHGWLELAPGRRQILRIDDDVVRVEPQASITGVLRSAVDGSPLASAWVWRPERAHSAVRTDAAGRFELFVAPGESASRLPLQLAAVSYLPQRILYQPQDPDAEPTFSMAPASAVAGRVVDAEGRGHADVAISPFGTRHAPAPRTYTDRQGRFFLGGLEPERPLGLQLIRDDLRRLDHELPPLRNFELRRGLRLVMDQAALVLGRVIDHRGKPVPDANVELEGSVTRSYDIGPAEIGGSDDAYELKTSSDGRFAATLTREGLLDLEVRAEGFAFLHLHALDLTGDEARFDLGDIAIDPSAPIGGRIADTADKPVENAEIYALSQTFKNFDRLDQSLRFRSPDTLSDAAGNFRMDGFHRGDSILLIVRRQGFAREVVPGVEAPTEKPLRIVLEKAAQLTGQVIDAMGEPVTGAEIFLRRPFAFDPAADIKTNTVSGGTFTLRDIAFGEVEIWARSRNYPPVSQKLEVTGDVDDLLIELETGFRVTGVVVNADGFPVHRAALHLRRAAADGEAWSGSRRGTTNLDGRFLLEGIGGGDWELDVNRDWFEITRQLHIDSDLELEVVLDDPGEPVQGVVTDRQGAGVDGVRLQLIGGKRSLGTVSKTGGAFRFPRVAQGVWRLQTAFSPSQVNVPVSLVEEPGRLEIDGDPKTPEPDLEIVVGRGAVLLGQVLGLTAYDLARVEISATGEKAFFNQGRIRVDAGGRFKVAGLAIGRWRIQAKVAGTGRQTASLMTLLPGDTEATLNLDFNQGLRLTGQVLAGSEALIYSAITVIDSLGSKVEVRTDSTGRFVVTGLQSGEVRLEILVDRSAKPWRHRFDLTSDRDLSLNLLD